MSIRMKLLLNASTVLLVIVGIVFASARGMRSVQTNIWALTQRSTPFQVKTLELDKAIQKTVGALSSANKAEGPEELKGFESEAQRSLGEVRQALDDLGSLSDGQTSRVHGELSATAKELLGAAADRLKAQTEAHDAESAARAKLKEAIEQLKGLDQRLRRLEAEATAQFQASVHGIRQSSLQLKEIDAIAASIPALQLVTFQMARAEKKVALISIKGKAGIELDKVSRNPYLKVSPKLQDGIRTLAGKLQDLTAAKNADFAVESDETRMGVRAIASDADALFNNIMVTVDAEAGKVTNQYEAESKRQEASFKTLGAAHSALIAGKELVSLGRAVEALAARLSAAANLEEVSAIEAEVKGAAQRAHAMGKQLTATLETLLHKGELAAVASAAGSLQTVAELVAGGGGMAEKVRRALELNGKARQTSAHLQETAARQVKKGQENVLTARSDQGAAIRAVNDSLQTNKNVILWSGSVAVLFGLAFALWIYASISKPLRALSRVASEVERTGDFSLRSDARGRDEVSQTVRAFNSLLETLHGVVADVNRVMADLARGDLRSTVVVAAKGDLESLKTNVNRTVGALNETIAAFREQARESSTASSESARAVDQVAESTREQLDAVSRLATAIQETAATLSDISGNAEGASSYARSSSELVSTGREKVEGMSRAMNAIAENSRQVTSITGMISDIADQTSLLALNAAIEAARAGEHGRGFAVVAEEVTKLAERVTALTKDISSVIGASVGESEAAVRQADEVRSEMEKIAKASGEIDDMLQRIATAIEEQSTTVTTISSDVGTLNDIAQSNAASADQVASSLSRLAQAAEAANQQVERFQT